MTGKVTDHIQCSRCREPFPAESKTKNSGLLCPECFAIRNREAKERHKIKRKLREKAKQSDWSWSGSSASIYW